MNFQEDEKKPVYEILDSVTITKQHFEWLNKEVLRIGQEARQYADERDLLRAEVEELTGLLKASTYYNSSDEVTRLKALTAEMDKTINASQSECRCLKKEVADLKSKVDRFKAEVERLNAELFTCSCANAKMNMHLNENARLKAEVERLTNAGDAMASSIQFNEEMAQDYNGPTIVHQSVQRWNAAKKGKPSV